MTEQRRLWSIRVDEARDIASLELIETQLLAIGEAWVGPIRLKSIAKRVALRRAAAGRTESAFAGRYGLPPPDGRCLYRYRLDAEGFAQLQGELAIGGLAKIERGFGPGLFVLWASEWFRRCYAGGGHRWAELASALGIPEDQALFRTVTATGLRQWQRDVIRSTASHEYLGSLAREGGFPTAAVDSGGRGWAKDVLEAIVSPLLREAMAEEDRALQLAEMHRQRLPQLFRDDGFVQLCADLALAIVRLRREAEPAAAQAGIPVLAWLQLNRPEWRETLPLTIGEDTAIALIDGLMVVEAATGGVIGVDRLLVRSEGGDWREAARIALDGTFDSAAMRAIDPLEGRLRAFAAGEMARAVPGELALLDPPTERAVHWTARSSRRSRGVLQIPFAVPVELDLRSGERRIARVGLSGGKPRRGQLLVAALDAGSAEAPQSLRIIGSGSGKYRPADVYLQAPSNWRVDATDGEIATDLGGGVGETRLWRVQGGAFITDATGDCFRILCSQPQDLPAKIELIGNHPYWAQTTGDVDLYLGPPIARSSRSEGSMFIRAIGSREWRPAPGTLPIGHYELACRDNRVLLDRRRIAVLPATAALPRSGTGAQLRYEPSGFAPATIQPDPGGPVTVSNNGAHWNARPLSETVYRFAANIEWPNAPSLAVSIDFPCAAAIAHWDGRVLPNGAQITLDDLGDLVAINDGPMQLVADLIDAQTQSRAEMSWQFIDELPMTSVAGDLASLLLPASIDATVKLGMHDGIETYWHLRPFEVRLEKTSTGIFASRGVVVADAELCGRALAEPMREVSFGSYSLLTEANHRPVALPDYLAGTWLLFLRAGGRVLSRPFVYFGTQIAASPQTAMTRAMAIAPRNGLDAALSDVLRLASEDTPEGIQVLHELIALVSSLRGIPPATFRILELLAHEPAILTRLVMLAAPSERDFVLALSDALPFAWCTVPQASWEAAQRTAFERALVQLEGLGDMGVPFAMETVANTRAAIIAREPLLGSMLLPIRDAIPIDQVAQSFLNRSRELIGGGDPERYRSIIGSHLPGYFTRFSEDVLDTLDAPCAAALAAKGVWTPQARHIRHIKTVARTFPTYFADAFTSTLKEHA